MKNQALFSFKDKSKKLKCHLLQYSFGALRVNSFLSVFIAVHRLGIKGFCVHIHEDFKLDQVDAQADSTLNRL